MNLLDNFLGASGSNMQNTANNNDLINTLRNASPQLREMAQNMKNVNNPQGLLNMLGNQNPLLQMLQGGANPQQLVMQQLQQQGIDPNVFINELKNILG